MNFQHLRLNRKTVLATLGVAIALPLWFANTAAIGQTPLQSPTQSSAQPIDSEAIQLFVNTSIGNDTTGNGTQASPYKTITQALRAAEGNTVIMLAPGTYSAESGETFPLALKSGVTLQGDPASKGRNTIIKGGAIFISPTFARQNIAVLAADRSSITGVTITNPHRRGYGLWVESSSPVISDNTFTGNTHDGISVTGNSAPMIRNNYFSENGANGITIFNSSRPEVRNNIFVKTGFGINVAQNAAPLLVENRIADNKDGVVVQGKAQPILRGNTIENNERDGIVAISAARPDLGTAGQPGGNIFRNNGRYQINASAASQIIPAFGNQLARGRTAGRLDLAGTVAQLEPISPASATSPTVFSSSSVLRTRLNAANLPQSSLQQTSSNLSVPPATTLQSSPQQTSIQIPVPAPASFSQPNSPPETPTPPRRTSRRRNSRELPPPPVNTQTEGLEITPPPATSTESSPLALSRQDETVVNVTSVQPSSPQRGTLPSPSIEAGLLPVPGSEIPIGNMGNAATSDNSNFPSISVSQNNPRQRNSAAGGDNLPRSLPSRSNRAVALGLRYRVVVYAESPRELREVRSLVPGAFRTRYNGRLVMQVGAYSDRAEAEEMLQKMTGNGLSATIEEL